MPTLSPSKVVVSWSLKALSESAGTLTWMAGTWKIELKNCLEMDLMLAEFYELEISGSQNSAKAIDCGQYVYPVTISEVILTGLQIVSQMGECSFV